MKSAKKYLAAILAVLHILTYSSPVHAQVAEIDASAAAQNAGFEAGATPTDFLPPAGGENLPVDGIPPEPIEILSARFNIF